MELSRQRQALIVFVGVAFVVPWIGWSLVSFGLVPRHSAWRTPLFFTGSACSIAGIGAMAWARGWGGVAHLLSDALRWRVSPVWWAFAFVLPLSWVLVPPLIFFAMHEAPIEFRPEAILGYDGAPALFLAVTGPLGEGFGWRGFLLPRLLERFSPMLSVLLLGLIWGVWHWPLYLQRIISSPMWWLNFLVGVTCFSVMLGALYLRTQSLLLTMLMHWNINVAQELVGGFFPRLAQVDRNEPALSVSSLAILLALTALAAQALPNAQLRRKTGSTGTAAPPS